MSSSLHEGAETAGVLTFRFAPAPTPSASFARPRPRLFGGLWEALRRWLEQEL
ncbi:MAG: hypothetical protein HYZ28_11845 [Myxococcales bacterium]|nr:hypothetical protein [Myxococcales bacterium]